MSQPQGPQSTRTRFGVAGTVYHQQAGQQPVAFDDRFTRALETDEQPYVRHTTVGEDWTPLDTGWVKQCSLLLITNDEGHFRQTIPSEEERQQAERKVLNIAVDPYVSMPFACVPPRESCRLTPLDLHCYRIRCEHGTARITIIAFPK